MGMRKLEAVCMLYHRVTHNNNWIFISFSAIIWSISLEFFKIISDIVDSFCMFRLFSVGFIKTQMVSAITYAFIES